MKTFSLTANIEFEAEDIDDAFFKLGNHFECVMDSNFEFIGELDINPADSTQE